MIYSIIALAIILILVFYPYLSKLLLDIAGKNVTVQSYKGMTVYISDNYPIIGSGEFLGPLGAAIKREYYTDNGKNTNIICWDVTAAQFAQGFRGTNDIIEHEGGHNDQYNRYVAKYGKFLGWLLWLGWGVCNYTELPFIGHNNLPIEKEPEADEK
jgi:hypothetical protein